jgi:DNA-binding transcriptional ArsR family regulator
MTQSDCIAALKALGEQTRIRILRLLFKEQLSVNEIAQRLTISQYNASRHLRIMREAGLLESRKNGQQRLYSVSQTLKSETTACKRVLNLDCCTFHVDELSP